MPVNDQTAATDTKPGFIDRNDFPEGVKAFLEKRSP